MDLGQVDRVTLKSIIKEILVEDVSIFKDVIKEILAENEVITNDGQVNRREVLEKMIADDFNKYDDTFRALA